VNPLEALGQKALGIGKALTLLEERHQRQEEDIKELRRDVSELRQRLAELITRVAVLEKGQEVVDARVDASLSRNIARLETLFRNAETERKIQAIQDDAERRIAEISKTQARLPEE
jgi:uncharacterized protein YhaN